MLTVCSREAKYCTVTNWWSGFVAWRDVSNVTNLGSSEVFLCYHTCPVCCPNHLDSISDFQFLYTQSVGHSGLPACMHTNAYGPSSLHCRFCLLISSLVLSTMALAARWLLQNSLLNDGISFSNNLLLLTLYQWWQHISTLSKPVKLLPPPVSNNLLSSLLKVGVHTQITARNRLAHHRWP